jgi:hypothetical protein
MTRTRTPDYGFEFLGTVAVPAGVTSPEMARVVAFGEGGYAEVSAQIAPIPSPIDFAMPLLFPLRHHCLPVIRVGTHSTR